MLTPVIGQIQESAAIDLISLTISSNILYCFGFRSYSKMCCCRMTWTVTHLIFFKHFLHRRSGLWALSRRLWRLEFEWQRVLFQTESTLGHDKFWSICDLQFADWLHTGSNKLFYQQYDVSRMRMCTCDVDVSISNSDCIRHFQHGAFSPTWKCSW